MQIAFGMLNIPPEVFWDMSFAELNHAFLGYQEKISGGNKAGPLNRTRLNELMELYPD